MLDIHQAVTARIGRERYPTTLTKDSYTWLSDEPTEKGGSAQGPTPNDLLAGAIASCKTITLRMYADRKGWPLEAVEVLAQVMPQAPSGRASIETSVRLLGADLTEEMLDRLHDIATRCPMHKLLEQGFDIVQNRV